MNPTYFSFGMIAFFAVLGHLMPRKSRPSIFFGVTVAPEFQNSAEAARITRAYQIQIWIHAAIAAALALIVAGRHNADLSALASLWVVAGSVLALARANRVAARFRAPANFIREASLAPSDEKMPGGVIAWLLPLLILAAAAVYLHFHWEQIPDRFPIHWGIDGTPNRWATRTVRGVYGPLLIGALTCLLLWGTAHFILRARRIAFAGQALAHEIRFRAVNLRALLVTEYLMGSCMALLTVVPSIAPRVLPQAGWLYSGIFMIFMLVLIGVMLKFGQGGTRLANSGGESGPAGDRTPDECWKFGILYVNRDDPAFFVEKRFGIGYTINLGNPAAVAALTAFIVLMAVTARLAH